jgi:hypothetical protein
VNTLDGDSTTRLLAAAVPEFGGRSYGLEPLVLPLTPHPPSDEGATEPEQPGDRADGGLGAPESAEQLFWFRWITGHQLTFIIWQEIGRLIAGAPASDPASDIWRAITLIRAYSAMLLYTASCTREVYHKVIRPSMALHHPGFSGSWARDYGPVRALMRGRLPGAWVREGTPLIGECALNDTVHEAIAAKLVPGAPSLLQSSGGDGRNLPRDMRAVLFDTYFLTLRAPCTPEEVTAQKLRRVRAVLADLRVNGLYSGLASSRDERPDVLLSPDVEKIERAMPSVLTAIARGRRKERRSHEA